MITTALHKKCAFALQRNTWICISLLLLELRWKSLKFHCLNTWMLNGFRVWCGLPFTQVLTRRRLFTGTVNRFSVSFNDDDHLSDSVKTTGNSIAGTLHFEPVLSCCGLTYKRFSCTPDRHTKLNSSLHLWMQMFMAIRFIMISSATG